MRKYSNQIHLSQLLGNRHLSPDIAKRHLLQPVVIIFKIFILVFALSACVEKTVEENQEKGTGKDDLTLSSSTVYLSEINGQYEVSATFVDANGVAYIQQPDIQWESNTTDVVIVDENGVITATGLGEAQIVVTANNLQKTIDVIVSSSVVTLSGVVRYEDREYDSSGFNSKIDYYKVARYVKVDLVSADNTVLQTTYTSSKGAFSFSGVIDSQNKITVYATTDISKGLDILVKDRSDQLYAVTANVNLDNNTELAVDIPLSSPASGAFNIVDVFTNAAFFTFESTDLNLVSLYAFWQENNSDGTYFCNGYDSYYCKQGKGVYIYNQVGGDTDEYDDDVLYHEFGHYFMDTLSRDDSMGGCHLLSSKDLDLRLSWSEGFGDFFPAAVKHWLKANSTSVDLISTPNSFTTTAYVDTTRTRAQIYIALNNLDQTRYKTAANEMAVAKILYDLYLQYGMADLVKVFTDYLPGVETPVNLESFWDGWLESHNPDQVALSQLQSIFNARSVYYQQDNYESDALFSALSRSNISNNSVETHYLYQPLSSGVDVDTIPFGVTNGKSYTVQTLNLSGGTDTYLRILDSQGNVLTENGVEVSNDDADESAYYGYDSICGMSRIKNNGTALSSEVSFTAQTTGTFYAEVRTTIDPDPYRSAGRYGNYDIRVQEF